MTKQPNRRQNRRQSEYALVTLAHITTILPYRLAETLERQGRLVLVRSGFYSDRAEALQLKEREK